MQADPKHPEPKELLEGMLLTSEQARALEASVEGGQGSVPERTRLIGFYSMAAHVSADSAWLMARHVGWLVEHAPEAPVLGTPYALPLNEAWAAEVGRLWRLNIEQHPRNTEMLVHAARFFSIVDRPFAEQIRYRLRLIDPRRFADFELDYPLPQSLQEARAPVPEEEREGEATQPAEALGALVRHLHAAWKARELERARELAEAALRSSAEHEGDPGAGDATHVANLVLGHLALDAGELNQAIRHLRAAGETSGSPTLHSFGPDMTLARRLLDEGRRDVVLEYLEQCRRFWQMGHALLDAWEADVREGRPPNFFSNLRLGER